MDEYTSEETASLSPNLTLTSAQEQLATESVRHLTAPLCHQSAAVGQRDATHARLIPHGRTESTGWDVRANVGSRPESGWELAEAPSLLRDARILIIDDCKLNREYLAGAVVAHGATSPAVAWDLPSLIAAFKDDSPRVILLSMATRDSAMLLRQSLKISPTAGVIALGVSEDDESEIVACAEAGVVGYHLRSDSLEDLLVLVRKVAVGESQCSPLVSAILLRRLSALASQPQVAAKELVLTQREAQILEMLELGLSNKDIASQLCIAVHTVKNHVHSVLTKLGVSTRAQAAAMSRRSGTSRVSGVSRR